MELDGNEYDRYMPASNAFSSLPTGRNASARGTNDHGSHGHSVVDRPGVGGRRASTPGMVGAVGMDEIVAENARELRRRSLANGFNLDYIGVGDSEADTFSRMVSPGGFSAGDMSQMGNEMGRLPTTIESFSEMDASAPELSAVGMMGVGNISGPEIQSSISMYADQQVLSGTSHSSPVTNSMAVSVPQSPAGPQMSGSPLGPGSHGHRMSVDSITSAPMAQMHMAQMPNQGMDQSLMDQMGGGSLYTCLALITIV